jgi:hypothetical protein
MPGFRRSHNFPTLEAFFAEASAHFSLRRWVKRVHLVGMHPPNFFMEAMKLMNGKTKKINGVDLNASAFAWVGDEQNTATWLLPVWIPGDAKKTLNALKTSLYHFDTAKIPYSERAAVWFTLYGALLAHGIVTDRRTFEAKSDAPTPPTESTPPVPVRVNEQSADVTDPKIKEAEALADRFADELLCSLGWE